MDIATKILAVLMGAYILYVLFSYVRAKPETLSKENLGKSFYSMGILGLLLIGFIALVVVLLRKT